MIRLFVYGTLMRGEHNHHFLDGARFDGVAWTRDAHSLHSFGTCPGLARIPAHGLVTGEVFIIDAPTLARCDRLEGHPNHYRRDWIALLGAEDALAYFYALGSLRFPRINSGSWRDRGRP